MRNCISTLRKGYTPEGNLYVEHVIGQDITLFYVSREQTHRYLSGNCAPDDTTNGLF